MKVKFIKPGIGIGMAYFSGDVCDMPELKAKELIEIGYVEEVPFTAPEIINDLPASLPGKKKLEDAGFTCIADLEKLEDYSQIPGIGKTLAKQIAQFMKK